MACTCLGDAELLGDLEARSPSRSTTRNNGEVERWAEQDPSGPISFLLKSRERFSRFGAWLAGLMGIGEVCPMSKETEYRRFAAEWFELAKRSDNQEDRTRRVTMAEAWLDLVERSRGTRPGDTVDHPLVQETFGRHRF